ncbi:unnamed protein product, partial [Urochloa humidicola]
GAVRCHKSAPVPDEQHITVVIRAHADQTWSLRIARPHPIHHPPASSNAPISRRLRQITHASSSVAGSLTCKPSASQVPIFLPIRAPRETAAAPLQEVVTRARALPPPPSVPTRRDSCHHHLAPADPFLSSSTGSSSSSSHSHLSRLTAPGNRPIEKGRTRAGGAQEEEMDHAAEAQRTDLMTITRHVLNEQGRHPESRGDFTILLSHIVLGCKFVASAVNKAGLAKLIGLAGETNVQGEEQKKLDVLSNEVFVKALVSSGRTCVLVSEENEEAIFVDPALRGKYCVCFDPLDGSSNIDCGVSIGTIFGIYMIKDKDNVTLDDVLQPGTNMLAAGYCMYGSSCKLVLSTGNGVNGFTLDPSLGEFILTHPNIKIPKKGKIYSVNEGNAKNWDAPTAKYVEKCKFPQDGSSPKSLRYIASMVADVHRTLLYGGIFLYPADQKSPNGKLRVLYEVFPMSFLMEEAGGQAFTGKQRALELAPTKLHDRSPVFLGSYDDVEEIKALYASESSTV